MEWIQGIHLAPHEDAFDVSMPWYNGLPAPWLKQRKERKRQPPEPVTKTRCHYPEPRQLIGLCFKKAVGFAQLSNGERKLVPFCNEHKHLANASPHPYNPSVQSYEE